jgi:hypothetical protein
MFRTISVVLFFSDHQTGKRKLTGKKTQGLDQEERHKGKVKALTKKKRHKGKVKTLTKKKGTREKSMP